MNRNGTYPSHAIVLRTRNLGEKDRIMTLLSPEGKFCAVAKGARATKSKLSAVSQPFVRARFLVARGRSLDIASQAEIEDAHIAISADLKRTAWASYLCELCDQLPEHQPEAEVFELLCAALGHLALREGDELALVGHWFQAHFLSILGYAPTIGICVANGEKIILAPDDDDAKIAFSPVMGGTLCSGCASRDPQRQTLSAGVLRALHNLTRAPVPPTGETLELTTAARRDLRDCLRRLLAVHLGARLKSQKFLDDVLTPG